MPNRRQFLAGSAAALSLAALPRTPAVAAPHAAGRAPNIVLILADDLGYGELGCYGQQTIRTPRIDALAAEGLRFTEAYSSSPVCAPSRCSLLTSLHTGHSAVRQNPFPGDPGQGSLRAGDTTFAEVLRSRGYRTACIGKWGFGPELADQPSHPQARGFEEFYGYIDHGHAHDYYPDYLWHNGEKSPLPQNAGTAQGAFAADLFEERALDFIDTHAAGPDPFLLFLAPTLPHFPNVVPAEDMVGYTKEGWGAPEKAHASQVARLDTVVGAVVDRLAQRGIREDTLIVFTSDNGPHEEGSPAVDPDKYDANGPLRGYKRNLYEGGIRIPLIVSQPGTIVPGTTHRPTPQLDLLPTFAELAAAPAPGDIDGMSIAPLLAAGTAAPHPHLFWLRNDPYQGTKSNQADGGRGNRWAEAVRKGDLKAVRFAPARDPKAPDSQWVVQLYNLAADPSEATDLAARPEHQAALTELTALMRTSQRAHAERTPYGVTIGGTTIAVPGQAFTVTTTLANTSDTAWTSAAMSLTVPDGWTAQAVTEPTAQSVAAGQSRTTTWKVTAPAGAAKGARFRLRAKATATLDANSLTFTGDRVLTTVASLPAPPTATAYLSDLDWAWMVNAWGPAERDMSNGKQAAGDGPPISLAGKTYAKGLGVHARSEIIFHLGGVADRFTALVGLDDFSVRVSGAGGVRARVFGDGVPLFDSRPLNPASGPKQVDVDVTGVHALRLLVEDANSNGSYDHTSWADAKVTV
ncbi:sulfatase-like hydrolase/transferase [Streptomyces sp. NPDC007984]|uniref:sulfatase-like hydrolase/transferase n=1 Tax=Streptomyces sp. NPDC007984 TaxID=3364801 RepID=UPI0036ED6EED